MSLIDLEDIEKNNLNILYNGLLNNLKKINLYETLITISIINNGLLNVFLDKSYNIVGQEIYNKNNYKNIEFFDVINVEENNAISFLFNKLEQHYILKEKEKINNELKNVSNFNKKIIKI